MYLGEERRPSCRECSQPTGRLEGLFQRIPCLQSSKELFVRQLYVGNERCLYGSMCRSDRLQKHCLSALIIESVVNSYAEPKLGY